MEKDSIVFYKDWWEAIQSLPEGKRLEAISAVMDYAFTGVEPTDAMLRFATAQIRMFINRDAKRYEEICRKRKEAIKKRWAKEKNTKESTPNKSIQEDTNEYKSIQEDTTHYLNENENENGNENENEQINTSNYLQTDNKDKTRTGAGVSGGRSVSKVLDQQVAECKASPVWKEGIRKKFHIDDDAEVDRLLDEFAVDMLCQETEVRHPKKFFVAWLAEKRQNERDRNKRTPGLGKGEWRDKQGRRRYAQSDVIVPEQAPPRPSEAHYWSQTANQWEKAK